MEKFHITIKNNETQETLVDLDTGVIIGAIDNGMRTDIMSFTHSGKVEIGATIAGAINAANTSLKLLPEDFRKRVKKLIKKL